MSPLEYFVISLLVSTALSESESQALACSENRSGMTFSLREAVRDKHNEYRSMIGSGELFKKMVVNVSDRISNMYKLKYSCKMEGLALTWANGCNSVVSDDTKYGLMTDYIDDQNVSSVDVGMLEASIKIWYENGTQAAMTDDFVNSNFTIQEAVYRRAKNHDDEAKRATKFYQVAFSELTEVGCAISQCNASVLFVCRYYGSDLLEYNEDKKTVKATYPGGRPVYDYSLFKPGLNCIYDHQCWSEVHPSSSCSSFQYLCCDDLRCSTYENRTDPLFNPNTKKIAGKAAFSTLLALLGLIWVVWT
ncbi:hypothetical protein QR680_006868 [Steinernema hermaphroditum]|uniref:SCP domain-containing protein n=1 Tax=Steinernema hermaphroditum TaxID=289476 RepID=A0AA39HWU2_9BILA|nr:hypothetical protein QR680_006868 [Steinernema hermaphroditum]